MTAVLIPSQITSNIASASSRRRPHDRNVEARTVAVVVATVVVALGLCAWAASSQHAGSGGTPPRAAALESGPPSSLEVLSEMNRDSSEP